MTPFAAFTSPPAIPQWTGARRVHRLLGADEPPKMGRPPKECQPAAPTAKHKPGAGRRVRPQVKWRPWTVITPANASQVPAATECWPLIGSAS